MKNAYHLMWRPFCFGKSENSHAFSERFYMFRGAWKVSPSKIKSRNGWKGICCHIITMQTHRKSLLIDSRPHHNAFQWKKREREKRNRNDWEKRNERKFRHVSRVSSNLNVNRIKNRTMSNGKFYDKKDVDNNLNCYDRPLTPYQINT